MDASTQSPSLGTMLADGQALQDYLLQGGTIGTLRGVTPRQLEAFYALGFNCFQSGRYEDAEKLFTYVLTHNHLDARTHKALGMALQAQRKHEQALKPYGAASLMDMTDPEPVVHMAECFLALGRVSDARQALGYAGGAFNRRPDARLQQRVALMNAGLNAAGEGLAAPL